MNRRHFLRNSSALLAATTVPSAFAELAKDNTYRKNIGLQLYTVRNELTADTEGTIKALAAAGYKQVEMFGFPKTDAVVKSAKHHGLAINSTHFEWECVIAPKDEGMSDFKKILDTAKEVGLSHLVIPYLKAEQRGNLDAYKKIAENANKASVLAKAAGIQLSYHNHSFEFKPQDGGKTGFDVFMSEFGKDMMFELDLFWVKLGGVEPLDLMKKLTGRISQLHLKDVKPGATIPSFDSVAPDVFQELGDGSIAWEPILAAAAACGVKHCHVEQDQSPNAMDSVKQSLGYLSKI